MLPFFNQDKLTIYVSQMLNQQYQ